MVQATSENPALSQDFNSSPLLWRAAQHHGKTVRIIDGIVMLRAYAVARFGTTERALTTLRECGWRFSRRDGEAIELRA